MILKSKSLRDTIISSFRQPWRSKMVENSKNFHINVAHDGGNDSAKEEIDFNKFIFPNVLARVRPGGEPQRILNEEREAVELVLNNFIDYMDVTIQSPQIHVNGRYYVGSRAQNSGNPIIEFNVNSNEGKATGDVGIISLLSLIAYNSVAASYKQNSELPDLLNIQVDKMATALPIAEYTNEQSRNLFILRFTDAKHVVIINNFENPISINIQFNKVDVQPEGAIAQYALIGTSDIHTKYRSDGIFDDFKKENNLKKFTGKDIYEAGLVLNIDIGGKTVDFSVMKGMSPLSQVNRSVYSGAGNALENAANALHTSYPSVGMINRHEFLKIASRGNDNESSAYRNFLNDQLFELENQISEQVRAIYAQTKNQIRFIVVSGGGSIILREHYRAALFDVISSMSPFGAAPILWIPDKFARTLNLDGLQFRLNKME